LAGDGPDVEVLDEEREEEGKEADS